MKKVVSEYVRFLTQLWNRKQFALVGAPIVVLLLFSLCAFFYALRQDRERIRVEFAALAEELTFHVRQELSVYTEVVYSIKGLFDASSFVDRSEFEIFCLPKLQRYPAIQALEWIPAVKNLERPAFEAAIRKEGFSDFGFKKWNSEEKSSWLQSAEDWAEVYYPVIYMTPFAGNESAFGIDLGSNPSRMDALLNAAKTGEISVTEPLRLAQEKDYSMGVLMFSPVYANGTDPGVTVAGSDKHLKGFTLGVYRVDDILRLALGDRIPEFVRMVVYDDADTPPVVVYDSGVNAEPGIQPEPLAYKTRKQINFLFGGRKWVFEFFAEPEYFVHLQSGMPWVFLLVGLLLTSLVGGVLAVVSAQSLRLNEQVKEQTRHLQAEIKQRKEREDELQALNRDIVRSNRDLEEFAYVASHDLQEPLRKVEAFGQLVAAGAGDSLPEQERDYLDRMLKSVHRMRGLIQSLLAYSRLATNASPFQTVDLATVLHGVQQDLEMRIHDLSAEIKAESLPEVFGDREQLGILMQNLVNNALKFHSRHRPRVVISHKVDAKTKKVLVSVADNGIGLNPKFAERIFILFQRLHSRSEYEGTGIGLALCRRIVERHGGRIWVESEEGQGSVFYFELPLAPGRPGA